MGNYHRFKDPAYFFFGGESFPGTSPGSIGGHVYNRANVEDEGTGSLGSANAEPQKGTGVNDKTFWVAFGEDATSGNVNRGMKALTQNTDVIDDILRTSVPKWTRLSVGTPGATFYQIIGDVFVGDDSGTDAWELIQVTSDGDSRAYNGLTPIMISAIDDGTPGNNVIGNGWVTNPTIRFNTTASVALYLYFGTRSSTARIVESEREAIWRGLMKAFTDAYLGRAQALHGLDERYRRAGSLTSINPAGASPGSGRVITRDGAALQLDPIDGTWDTTRQPDPFLSLYKTGLVGAPAALAQDYSRSGEIGYLFFDPRRFSTSDAGELSHRQRPFGGFVAFSPRDVDADTIVSSATYTRIHGASANATLNKTAGPGVDYITLEGNNYFRSGGDTAIRLGRDVLLVTFADGTQQAYRIWDFFSDTEARVRTLGGSSLVSFTADESVRVDWLQLSFVAAGGDGISGAAESIPSFGWYSPTKLSAANLQNPGNTEFFMPPEFIGVKDPSAPSRYVARFGYHDPATGLPAYTGSIESTGKFTFLRGGQYCALIRRTSGTGSAGVSYTLDLDPYAEDYGGIATYQNFTYEAAAAVGTPQTLNVNWASSTTSGGEFILFVKNTNGCVLTVVWDSHFVFSGTADGVGPQSAGEVVKWVGQQGFGKMYMTRTDY